VSEVNDGAESLPSPHVLIVGGGASGTTCALFLARAGISSTIFDHDRTILKRAYLHNLPGVDPILGVDWLAHLRTTVAALGLSSTIEGRVTSVTRTDGGFSAESSGEQWNGDYLVIASGQVNIDFTEPIGLETTDPVQPYVQANIVVDRWGATNVDGVFACGVVAGHPSQAVICAGSGATVAVRITSLVRGEFWVDHDEAPKAEEGSGD
jgi:thioredoxin reductase (NADPH)